jgi:hypothetical protein
MGLVVKDQYVALAGNRVLEHPVDQRRVAFDIGGSKHLDGAAAVLVGLVLDDMQVAAGHARIECFGRDIFLAVERSCFARDHKCLGGLHRLPGLDHAGTGSPAAALALPGLDPAL